MCRNIKTLFNFDPPATQEEIRAASLQFVRKLSGFTKPSKANEEVFDQAVDEVAEVAERLIASLNRTANTAEAAGGRVQQEHEERQRWWQYGLALMLVSLVCESALARRM